MMEQDKRTELVLFGAQATAVSAAAALERLGWRVACFLVTSLAGNPPTIAGAPVCELAAFAQREDARAAEILIAVPENVQAEVERSLDDAGLLRHQRLDADRWAQLMAGYYAREGRFLPLEIFPAGSTQASARVFLAKFYRDCALSKTYAMPGWYVPLQVGAARCTERVAVLTDDQGDQISAKNGNYSELTGLYWLWKNVLPGGEQTMYYGIGHYRRILLLTKDDLYRLQLNAIDVVLPYPMRYWPNAAAHHKRYLSPSDWQAVERALQELAPREAEHLAHVMGQPYFYNYNILLARQDVLSAYCAWLFPVLKRVEELSVPRGSERQDRYIGYVGETLCTLYFLCHQKELRIAHTECKLLV